MLGGLIIIGMLASLGLIFFAVPPAEGLGYYVRIAFVHIPLAWVSVLAFLVSAYQAVRFLRRGEMRADRLSAGAVRLGFIFVILATVTGAIFSRLTWGAFWNWDPRQTTIFVLLLIYGAYLTLRSALPPGRRRAVVSAVYALFSFLTVPFLVFIVPRLYFSLHPSPVINGAGRLDMDGIMVATLLVALLTTTLIFVYLLRRIARDSDE